MDQKAITKARGRLRIAEKAIKELEECNNFESFCDIWFTFLTSAKGIYTVLEQGAKISPQSRQWFGAKSAERRNDELLQYVYQARNDDEHGIEPISKEVPGRLSVGVRKEGYSDSIIFNANLERGVGKIEMRSLDGKPILIEQTFPHIALITVRGRGKDLYDPPKYHKGKILTDISPSNIAKIALSYLSELVESASMLR
ncbi:hypothetical protein E9232_001131 [Inquilinus ginsengisoli]|uniref:Uncharacterized protein n=1 Tax=Inquilinus ginsengisoli TaxID=363840 RepID=A0ABU1JJ29_9PROT|nr:hypothetical protein [Inquilinus ginsengisoli]MDR6288624.1 hypothetical protein [Inquilinus ginsengisoli]